MQKFVLENFDYAGLKETLEDGLCHVYKYCQLPNSFNKQCARIGFEKDAGSYILYIDKNLSCNRDSRDHLLSKWLSAGELRFLDFNDIKEFLKSLQFLYS